MAVSQGLQSEVLSAFVNGRELLTMLTSNPFTNLSSVTVTAAGSTRGNATTLTAGVRNIVSGTTGQGVRLPAMSPGQFVIVANVSSPDATLHVYPAEGCNFAGFSANSAFLFISGASYYIFADSATQLSATGGECRNPASDDYNLDGLALAACDHITDPSLVATIDVTNRILYGSNGTTPLLNFATQPSSANQTALTDSTGGSTANATLADVTATPTQALINANFAKLAKLVNQLRADLVTLGLIKGSA